MSYAVFGPGFSGLFDHLRDAKDCISRNKSGDLYVPYADGFVKTRIAELEAELEAAKEALREMHAMIPEIEMLRCAVAGKDACLDEKIIENERLKAELRRAPIPFTRRDIERRWAIVLGLRRISPCHNYPYDGYPYRGLGFRPFPIYEGSGLGSSMAAVVNIADTVGRDQCVMAPEPSPGLSITERKALERATIREYRGPWRPFYGDHDRW